MLCNLFTQIKSSLQFARIIPTGFMITNTGSHCLNMKKRLCSPFRHDGKSDAGICCAILVPPLRTWTFASVSRDNDLSHGRDEIGSCKNHSMICNNQVNSMHCTYVPANLCNIESKTNLHLWDRFSS